MDSHHIEDKQLRGISLEAILEKRRLDQAMNMKEFAVCAGICYSAARRFFRLDGFPVISGMVFWQDFVKWRNSHIGPAVKADDVSTLRTNGTANYASLPPRASRILLES